MNARRFVSTVERRNSHETKDEDKGKGTRVQGNLRPRMWWAQMSREKRFFFETVGASVVLGRFYLEVRRCPFFPSWPQTQLSLPLGALIMPYQTLQNVFNFPVTRLALNSRQMVIVITTFVCFYQQNMKIFARVKIALGKVAVA